MKYGKLLLLGLAPLPAGYLLDYAMTVLSLSGAAVVGLGVLLPLLWGCLAFLAASPRKKPIRQALALCAFGLAALALVLFQELALGRYWGNFLGIGSQLFFLPFLSLGFSIADPVAGLFLSPMRVWPGYIAAWLLMLALAWAGCAFRKRRG